MSERDLPAGAGRTERRPAAFLRAWSWLVDGLAALGTLLIALLTLVIFSDVLARNLVGGSLPLVSELGALMLVMIVYLQLGTTVRHNGLARTDLFYSGFRARHPLAGGVLACLIDLVGFACCATIAWSTSAILAKDLKYDDYIGVTGVMTLPTWQFRALILLGVGVAAAQFLLQAGTALHEAFTDRGERRS